MGTNKEEVQIILKNILDKDKLNIYIGYKTKSYCNDYYVKYGGSYANKIESNKIKYIGVYWLYDADEVVYIGYSRNLINRIKKHISSDKVWDKVKIILFDDINIARSVERTLLLNIQTRHNNPNFNRGYTAKSRYMFFKSQVKMSLQFYAMYSHLSKDEILEELGVADLDFINNIDFYRRYANISFQEYEENFNLKLKGLKHNLLIT